MNILKQFIGNKVLSNKTEISFLNRKWNLNYFNSDLETNAHDLVGVWVGPFLPPFLGGMSWSISTSIWLVRVRFSWSTSLLRVYSSTSMLEYDLTQSLQFYELVGVWLDSNSKVLCEIEPWKCDRNHLNGLNVREKLKLLQQHKKYTQSLCSVIIYFTFLLFIII